MEVMLCIRKSGLHRWGHMSQEGIATQNNRKRQILTQDSTCQICGMEERIQQKKILYIPDVNHGVCILSYVLILDPLSYNKIGEFLKTMIRIWAKKTS
jgi:hypothetical protein